MTVGTTPEGALATRLVGGVWGHLVGDAVGVQYEFREPERIGKVRWGETGTHGQPPGTAIAMTRAARHGTIENRQQERFVREWTG